MSRRADRRSPEEQRAEKRKNSLTARGIRHGRPPTKQTTPYLRRVDDNDASFLYDLLQERTPQQSISHRAMPSWPEHVEFVRVRGYYHCWYLIMTPRGFAAGAIYVTRKHEIGVSILKKYQRKGYATIALHDLMEEHPSLLRVAYANINPANEASMAFWINSGFKLLQLTFVKETVPA